MSEIPEDLSATRIRLEAARRCDDGAWAEELAMFVALEHFPLSGVAGVWDCDADTALDTCRLVANRCSVEPGAAAAYAELVALRAACDGLNAPAILEANDRERGFMDDAASVRTVADAEKWRWCVEAAARDSSLPAWERADYRRQSTGLRAELRCFGVSRARTAPRSRGRRSGRSAARRNGSRSASLSDGGDGEPEGGEPPHLAPCCEGCGAQLLTAARLCRFCEIDAGVVREPRECPVRGVDISHRKVTAKTCANEAHKKALQRARKAVEPDVTVHIALNTVENLKARISTLCALRSRCWCAGDTEAADRYTHLIDELWADWRAAHAAASRMAPDPLAGVSRDVLDAHRNMIDERVYVSRPTTTKAPTESAGGGANRGDHHRATLLMVPLQWPPSLPSDLPDHQFAALLGLPYPERLAVAA